MSAFSRVEFELVHNEISFDRILDVLLKGCWIEESDLDGKTSADCFEFTGGFHESYFKINIMAGQMIIESDSPWELELLTAELKEVAVKKSMLVKN